jgi:two-component system cell cycle response regulator DivK
MKVLYVEDNPANVFLVKRVARMGNHEIINYIDGGQALKKYDDINPDLVLMDIQLAGDKSGLDVVRELRARGIKTPIIAVTAYAMVGDKERCIDAGCDDYLAKPLPIPRLVEIFDAHNKRVLAAGGGKPAEAPKVEPVAAPVAVAEAPKAEPAPVVVVEAPKVEAPKLDTAPLAEKPKTAPLAEVPKLDTAPPAEAPKVETISLVDKPKLDTAPLAEKPKTAPLVEAPKLDTAPLAEKPKAATAPLVNNGEAPASEVKAQEKSDESPTEPKPSEADKKEAEQTSVKPEASSN